MNQETVLKNPEKSSYIPLVVITMAHLMAVLDNTIMMVALPSIQQSLGISSMDRQWIVTAYTLAYAGLLLLGGKLADRFGANRTLIVGVIGFAIASAIGGVSISAWMLIAARAVEGFFGAILTSSTKTLLALTYTEKKQRAKAMGIFGGTLAMGGVLGMVLGGLLTGSLGWRWCLFINLPISLVVIIMGLKFLPRIQIKKQVRIDLFSATVFLCTMVALVYGFGQAASNGWISVEVLVSLGLFVLLAALFILTEQKSKNPLFPMRIITECNRGGAFLSMIFNSFGTLGLMLILTFQLQKVQNFSPLSTGFVMMPMMLMATVMSAVVAPKLMRVLPPRWMIAGGVLFSGLGLVPLIFLRSSGLFWPLLICSEILEGFGTGIGSAPAMHTSLIGILSEDVGIASSASSCASQIGSSIGAALLNTIAVRAAGVVVGMSLVDATMHGFAVACGFGFGLLLIVSVVVFAMIRLPRPT